MFVGNIIAVSVFAGLGATASAKESYKFDPSGSTIGFSVHQFLARFAANSRTSAVGSKSIANIREFFGNCADRRAEHRYAHQKT